VTTKLSPRAENLTGYFPILDHILGVTSDYVEASEYSYTCDEFTGLAQAPHHLCAVSLYPVVKPYVVPCNIQEL
jgi:hypothetical protein